MALDLIAELEGVIEAFAAAGVQYALCGGLAVAIHGYPRATMDIDVLVEPAQLALALATARGIGFDIPARSMTFGVRTGTPREVQRVSKLDAPTGALLSLDLRVVGATLAEPWRTRQTVVWRGRPVEIVSRAGLIVMKRLAARPQDLADIAALEGGDDDGDA
ncbi:MAG: hypothetical protein IPL61_25225 [Myxococcales bacterium]|nr:hypothetical protein [Myxococcales bacterium]